MKTLELKELDLENFMKFEKQHVDFTHKTDLRGRNRVGKSTIMNAFYWVFFNTTPDGRQADNVRPLKSGKTVDFVDIIATFTVLMDGKQHVIKKTQKQKWVKHRGGTDKKFEGNINEFEIDGFPYKPNAYEEFLSNFCPTDTFLFCSNPQKFLTLAPADQRNTLEELFGFDAEEFASEEFNGVSDIMMGHTVEETLKKLKRNRLSLDKKLKEIPVRIDEVSKTSGETTGIEEIDNAIEELQKSIDETDSKLSTTEKSMEVVDRTRRELMSLKTQKSGIEQDATDSLLYKRRNLERELNRSKDTIKDAESQIKLNENIIVQKQNLHKKYKADFNSMQEEWKAEKAKSFEEPDKDFKCPLCGSQLPEEKQEEKVAELKSNFEREQLRHTSDLESKGIDLKKSMKQITSDLDNLVEETKEHNLKIDTAKQKIEELEKRIAELKEEPDLSHNQDYERICNELDAKNKALESETTPDDNRDELNKKKAELLDELSDWRAKKNKIKADETQRAARIAELETELTDVSQKEADIEKQINLVEKFGVEKNRKLSELVNTNFDIVKFRFSRPLINGGVEDCCQIEVDGVNYYQTLNVGDKKLAEIDIARGFQKVNELNLPIFLDEASEVDADRIPDMEQQLITMSRSDEHKLEVK